MSSWTSLSFCAQRMKCTVMFLRSLSILLKLCFNFLENSRILVVVHTQAAHFTTYSAPYVCELQIYKTDEHLSLPFKSPEAWRTSINLSHHSLFLTSFSISFQLYHIRLASGMVSHCQVFSGLPPLHFPCGFQVEAFLVILVMGFSQCDQSSSICPKRISCSAGICWVPLHSSRLGYGDTSVYQRFFLVSCWRMFGSFPSSLLWFVWSTR